MRGRLAMTVLMLIVGSAMFAGGASSRSSAAQKQAFAKRYYHANGYIRAIGKNARRTIYNPDRRISQRWRGAVRYLISVRHTAYVGLHPNPRHRVFAGGSGASYAQASWYGPGLYGNGMACGGVLTPGTLGVAHKTLPCGTRLRVCYAGRCAEATVVDRGPYVAGRDFDLTGGLKVLIGFGSVGTISYTLL